MASDAVAFTDAAWLADVDGAELHGEPGYSTLQRLWERPTLEVTGLEAGGKYSVIPHVARAQLSCRLVHDQDPAAVLAAITQHLNAQRGGRVCRSGCCRTTGECPRTGSRMTPRRSPRQSER